MRPAQRGNKPKQHAAAEEEYGRGDPVTAGNQTADQDRHTKNHDEFETSHDLPSRRFEGLLLPPY
jgi:hypothetical protein